MSAPGARDAAHAVLVAVAEGRHLDEKLDAALDAILAKDVPYVLLWNKNDTRLLCWNKFGAPAAPLGKYGDERAAHAYWWFDRDAAADLAHAMKTGRALPARPARAVYVDPAP